MPESIDSTSDTPELKALPDAVETALGTVGVNGDRVLQLQTDLDSRGRYGERYLVATPQKLVVVENNGSAKIERELPLQDIASVESKGLSGASTLEIRLKTETGEKAVEILRGSGSKGRELSHVARQLEHLRDHGTLPEERDDSKWKRRECPKCGRALPWDSDVCSMCVDRLGALKRLYSYMAPYKWLAVTSMALNIGSVALSFVPQLATKTLVDRVFPPAVQKGSSVAVAAAANGQSQLILAEIIGAIFIAGFLTTIAAIIRGRVAARLGASVLHDVRSQLYTHLQRLSVSYYDKREVGAVMSRVQNDVGALQNFLLDTAENAIISSLTILCVITILFLNSPLLSVLVLIPVPFVVVGTRRYWAGLIKLWRRVWHQNSSLGAGLADALGGVRVVRAFGAEEREVDRFSSRSSKLRDATMNVESRAASFYPIMGFVMGLGFPIVWFFGGNMVLSHQMSFGTLILFLGLLGRLYDPIQQLTRQVNAITRSMTAAERVFEVLDTDPEVKQARNPVELKEIRGEVDFDHVTFGYEKHRPVLNDVSLHVEPGEMIGLVGHSGAGKSTLINLLLRFYDVTDGALKIDGIDIRDIKRDDLRLHVGVVLQESYLFHGSIYSNIAYGRPEATPAEIIEAARAAHAHDFIVGFPDGYDTLVGERGTRLSGGERQRIAIARAILHNPKILILDEATASVDTQTEESIQNALGNLTKGRTTFAIAHRLSTLRNADRLVVVDKGKIAEIGTHDELMERRGVFFKLVQAQQSMNEIVHIAG
ncbi:putative ABC transporter ATP-binding protein [Abditibacteriota bacterium]|nr:putative ABC transporter ATP-binding protein [Abditibacteriota bacterium]